MAVSFKSGSKDVVFNPTTMTVEKVKDADTGATTGYIVVEHYIDEYEHPQQEIHTISEKAFNTLNSK